MSTTPPPPNPPPAAPPTASPSPAAGPRQHAGSRTAFWDWLLRLDLRRSDERWLGGVAAGVAERLGVDPVLARVGFVVLGLFGGAGLLVYAAAWLLLPDRTGGIEARAVVAGEVSAAATGALALLVVSVAVPDPWRWWSRGPLISGGDLAWFLASAAAITVVVLLVSRWANPQVRRERAAVGTEAVGTEVPVAGEAWRPPRPVRPGVSASIVTAVVGLALLLATATWLLLTTPGAGDVLGVDPPGSLPDVKVAAAACAVAAAVIGLALVVVGATGRRGAGLGFWGIVAVLGALAFAVVPVQARGQLVGSASWQPTSWAAAERGYALGAGEATVDLSDLPTGMGGVGRPPVDIPIRHGFGHLTVVAPEDMTVTVRGQLLAGQVVTSGRGWRTQGQADGLLPDATMRADGPLTHAATVPYVVDVKGGFGEITVKRVAS